MNQYQFQQIVRRMEQRYGKMKKNEEDRYAVLLFPMESNLLKTYRKNPAANSRRLEEAVMLSLYDIEGRINGERKGTGSYENRENMMFILKIKQVSNYPCKTGHFPAFLLD